MANNRASVRVRLKTSDPCAAFMKLPFPMFWFLPPQKPEFASLMKKAPDLLAGDGTGYLAAFGFTLTKNHRKKPRF